jgi:excisionase family DNA binding protein
METSDSIASTSKPVPAPAPMRLLLTIPEAAASLGVSRSLIYELVHIGTITTIKIGRSRRVPVAALENFIARQLKLQGE